MSKTMNARGMRWQLLATVSGTALLWSVSMAGAADNDADRPQLWIEMGGQFEQIRTEQEAFVPPFFAAPQTFTTITPQNTQKPLDFSFGEEGKISFQPDGSDWVFGAAIRYGRSSDHHRVHQSTAPKPFLIVGAKYHTFPPSDGRFADAVTRRSEKHIIMDFQAGRDVGLGMLGRDASSTVSAGVRFAQFNTGFDATLGLGPSPFQYVYFGPIKLPQFEPHTFLGEVKATRSFRGLGPSLSWDASAGVAGSADTSELTIDWGINAALLFGRQKARTQHQTTGFYKPIASHGNNDNLQFAVYQHGPYHSTRSRAVTVPNIGGFAGVSLKFPNAKVSLGYRADWFFGAMDGGIDTRKNEDIGFHGPFASISVGLGD